MSDSTINSDKILADARCSLAEQKQGGFHRRQLAKAPIGRGSAEIRRKNLKTRLKLIGWSLLAVLAASMMIGLVSPIGVTGLMIAFMTVIATTLLFANYPKVKVPQRDDLNRGDVRQMVARTELWLEAQRPALPPPAVTLVDQIGVQLDALGLQLQHVDPLHPAAVETRKLIGETLPGMVDAYRRIPQHLRTEQRAGGTPDAQLTESLGKISQEIDSVTRQLADGALDDLAIQTRYLEYRYGASGEPAALPEPGQWNQAVNLTPAEKQEP